VIALRTPKRQMMFCKKNFLIAAELMLMTGFASIHLVKYLTAMMANEILSCYDRKSIIALSWGQWAYYVYAPSLERP
jgi:hypothetical protein